jgi:hypothetical protein
MQSFDHFQRRSQRSASPIQKAKLPHAIRSPLAENQQTASPSQAPGEIHSNQRAFSLKHIPISPPAAAQVPSQEGRGTALPSRLKAGMETLSGLPMDDVRVHYNSSHPLQLQAAAYTQGAEIYVGPGQEKHLAHEAWHIVQQKQGRVLPTHPSGNAPINDSPVLEREAETMGQKARMMFRQRWRDRRSIYPSVGNPLQSDARPQLASATQSSTAPIQMVRITNSKTGEDYEQDTEDMTPQERRALALELFQLANFEGLRQLREAHPDEDFSHETLAGLAAPVRREDLPVEEMESEKEDEPEKQSSQKRKRANSGSSRKKQKRQPTGPRVRPYHNLSEGESESEDPDVVWRALREDEDPSTEGLRPPEGHDPSITASAHVAAGSKAKIKSGWISATRSRKVAGAWSTEKGGGKRVARFRIPKGERDKTIRLGGKKGEESRKVYDLTEQEQAKEVFPALQGTAYNAAKGSQELLIHGGLGPEDVMDVFQSQKISVKDYNKLKEEIAVQKEKGGTASYGGMEVYAAFRTRAKQTGQPHPRVLLREPKPEKEKPEKEKDEDEDSSSS